MIGRSALAALLVLGLTASPAAAGDLAATQRVLAREMAAAGPATGAYVVDMDTGQELFEVQPDVKRIPASVNKLFTTSTALSRFGADHQFATDVLAQTAPDPTGVIAGDIYLRGGGDPTFTTKDARALARDLSDQGVAQVTGRVIGDETAWDARRGTPASAYRTSMWIGPLSALTLDRGFAGKHFQTNPPLTAAKAFDRQLRKLKVRVRARPRAGATPPTAVSLDQWLSPTVGQLVARTLIPSDNFLAESLIKAIGAEYGSGGSTASGAAVVRATVARMGARPKLLDGSGLSRRDRTSPRDVVDLIRAMDASENGPLFEGSLPVAGRTGTLSHRMRKTAARRRCHAKTGTLSGVSALAGYCDTRGGERVAFAFLMNGVSDYYAHIHQDRMAAALARYG